MPLQLRAMLEALLLAIILWLPLLLFQSYHSPNLSQLAIDLLVGPLCMLYYVLRLRVPGDFLKRQSLVDTTVALLLAAVLPLSALVSYLVVGRVTNRLKSLATATSLLCGGDYAVRIPVAGEDEVARLQT